MTPLTLTSASGRFEAARAIDSLGADHRSHALHGHGFQVSVCAALPDDWAPFPGAEVGALRQRLEEVLAPLNYAHLNVLISVPTDENIARWIHARLDLPGLDRVAVQSTADHGVELDRDGQAHVWRRYRFSAAHRLPHVPAGHKCGRMHGHGFEVVLQTRPSATSTASLSISGLPGDVLDAAWAPLQRELDHRCLNDIDGLENPTSEAISAWLWARLQPVLPELTWVTVFETASCGANFDGLTYRIWKDFTLDSATQLKRAPSSAPQSALHGHTYTLRLHLSAPLDTVLGWTVDFGDVKAIFDPIFKALDHRPLHELAELAELTDADTASVADWIFRRTRRELPQLVGVDLYERDRCGAIVANAPDGAPIGVDFRSPALPA